MDGNVNMNVVDPSGQPDDLNGIGGMNGPEPDLSGTPESGGPVRQGGLVLPEAFIRGIISAPFNVANSVWKDACPPLTEDELNSGIIPIQAWIEESTAGMAIQKPGQVMALMWLGSMAAPRALSVIAARNNPKKAQKKPDGQPDGQPDQNDNRGEGGGIDLGNGIYLEPELR